MTRVDCWISLSNLLRSARASLQPPCSHGSDDSFSINDAARNKWENPHRAFVLLLGVSLMMFAWRDQSFVAARDRSFQSAPCFCQFIRMWRLVALFLPSATASASLSQWNRTIAAGPTTRMLGA